MNQKISKGTALLLQAVSFAARAHKNQFRKDKETPYVSHPFRVCLTLRHIFGVTDEKILAAALLHDTVEDTPKDFDDIKEFFGPEIAHWVALLSKDKRLPEEEREKVYAAQLKRAPLPVKLIKLADIHDNLLDTSTLPSETQRARTVHRVSFYLRSLKDPKNPLLAKCLRKVQALLG